MFGVREWDYIFKFRQAEGQPDKVCQYKVLFDKDKMSQSMFFQPEDCLKPALPAAEPAPAPVQAQARTINLAADATFDFGSARLRPEGMRALDKLVVNLSDANVRSVDIVGYTDRIGSAEGNQRLSLARANSIRDYLVQGGIPYRVISTQGRGAANPLVSCPGATSPSVIACLAENRRTSITVVAD